MIYYWAASVEDCSILITLDLRRAFDTDDCSILLTKKSKKTHSFDSSEIYKNLTGGFFLSSDQVFNMVWFLILYSSQ